MKETTKYDVLAEAKRNLRVAPFAWGHSKFICLEIKGAISMQTDTPYHGVEELEICKSLIEEVFTYMPKPEDTPSDSWTLEAHLEQTQPNNVYSADEIQAMRHAILDKMIFNHASDSQKKVMLLERVKVNLKTEDIVQKGKHYFICIGLEYEATHYFQTGEDIVESLSQEVSRKIKGHWSVRQYLEHKFSKYPSFDEVMTYRHKILDELIAKYKEEVKNEG